MGWFGKRSRIQDPDIMLQMIPFTDNLDSPVHDLNDLGSIILILDRLAELEEHTIIERRL